MKVWILDCDANNFENLTWGNDERDIDLDFIQSFCGESKIEKWVPVQLVRMYNNREFSNTPALSAHIPVFDIKAINMMKKYLVDNTEILPVLCGEFIFYIINVIKVLDCIDYEKSDFKTFSDGKRIMRFRKYVFDENKIKGYHIFKIKDAPLGRPFVSDEFRNSIISSDLKGFKFELAWDSEI